MSFTFVRHLILVIAVAGLISSCTSMWKQKHQTHGGVHYRIDPGSKNHRVEKGTDGRLMFDSPELTVVCDNGRLTINGIECGTVERGDHVEITNLQTVLVNGQRRGDCTTGRAENAQRLRQRKQAIQSMTSAASAE